ncbi:sulfite exporter TauE/SafE family protein [Conexibacter woesei]|uniref:sulfite exporter TauE/SafE family protein n=1 Tax=Conexibacter woesei TaxID=191495 RepID=UPI0004055BA1|nr:sulfite exporter TauE/SafE family protein [Conexibacter woesei]
MDAADAVLLAAAGVTTGAINAVAGGGSLVSFPALIATGLSPLSANVSNLIATLPGYLSSAAASREELAGQRARVRLLAAASAVGAAIGTTLLLVGPADTFKKLAPWLILMACALLAAQPFVARYVARSPAHHTAPRRLVVSVGIASVYGGYFGAGLGIILLAALGLTLEEPLQRLNALKQVLSLTVAVVSAVAVALFGPVSWLSALVVGAGTLVGGRLGVGVARKLPDQVLRGAVIALGVTVAVVLLLRG